MKIRAKIFVAGNYFRTVNMAQCPAVSDTLRLDDERYAIVTEVIWCIDESDLNCQRVNIRTVRDDG